MEQKVSVVCVVRGKILLKPEER